MGKIDRRDMSEQDRRHRCDPSKARADDGDVDAIIRRPEQIPAEAERIRRQRNDILPLDQQEREVMREMVADDDGH